MILGAGPAQVPLIRAAKAMGLYTIAATIPGDYPGIAEADAVAYTDITDAPAIAEAAKKYGVAGVTSCCSEICLPAQAHACAVLGLPGPSEAAAEISVNKLAMKRAFDAGGVRTAPWRPLGTEDDVDAAVQALGFPLVVKAADLQGSNGVYVARDRDGAHRAFRQALALSGRDFCLAEAFIDGESFCAEAFVQKGDILFVLPDGNLTVSNPGRPNIPVGHYAPLDRGEAVHARIRALAEKAIRACGIDNCAVDFDMILRDGEPYVIELTARAGATGLSELIGAYFGVDYYQMILLAALGRDALPVFNARPARPQPAAVSMLCAPKSGVVRAVSLPERLPDHVRGLSLLAGPGDRVRRFENAGDRIGQVLVLGDSAEECLARLSRIMEQISIEVE